MKVLLLIAVLLPLKVWSLDVSSCPKNIRLELRGYQKIKIRSQQKKDQQINDDYYKKIDNPEKLHLAEKLSFGLEDITVNLELSNINVYDDSKNEGVCMYASYDSETYMRKFDALVNGSFEPGAKKPARITFDLHPANENGRISIDLLRMRFHLKSLSSDEIQVSNEAPFGRYNNEVTIWTQSNCVLIQSATYSSPGKKKCEFSDILSVGKYEYSSITVLR